MVAEGGERPGDGFTEYEHAVASAATALFGPEPRQKALQPEPELVSAAARRLWGLALAARASASALTGLGPDQLDALVRHRKLALALGGGGGCGYVYLGCFQLLEEWKLVPSLIAGSSMGAVLGLMRARREHFDVGEVFEILGQLRYRRLFRFLRTESHYAIPGAFRLYLRAALQRFLPEGEEVLSALKIPLVVNVTGIRAGMLPRPLEAYEHLLDVRALFPPTPGKLRARAGQIVAALGELIAQPNRLAHVYLGADAATADFDALDAVGFSSSLPGVIHYDVLRRDAAAHQRLGRLLSDRDLGWLADGGLVENCPARCAQEGLRRRGGGHANALVLALDAFSPKLTTPAWLPLERLAHENVRRALPWSSVYVPFSRTLSPLEIVPGEAQARRAIALGRAQLAPHLPLLARALEPLPDLAQSRPVGFAALRPAS
ncbi:MAG: patatin-like phospholipase family protein [Myxococcales bacterium]